MLEPKQEFINLRVNKCKEALEKQHIKTYITENKEEANQLVNSLIEDHSLVCDGGSMSLQECGIIETLHHRNITFHSHSDPAMSKQESDEEARKAFYADTFLCSANAITMKGELINVDGHGNRVSVMIFGPKQVIIVAGYNKIVEDEQSAIQRIRTIAAPANCMRLNKKTPCRFTGSCKQCYSEDRICSSYVKINYDKEDRIRVILVKENLGY